MNKVNGRACHKNRQEALHFLWQLFCKLRSWSVWTVAGLLIGCGGGGSSPTVTPSRQLSIDVQPQDQSVIEGNTVTLSVVASHAQTYEWQRQTTNGWTPIDGENRATLTLKADLAMAGAVFRVIVRNGSAEVTSAAITVKVTEHVISPSITVQPTTMALMEGQDANFHVTATGTSLRFKWQISRDGQTWTDAPNGANATLVWRVLALSDDQSRVRVEVSNSAGQLFSDTVRITVSPAPIAPSFTVQPSSVRVVERNAATLLAAAIGTPVPDLQWQTLETSEWKDVPNAIISPLIISNVTLADHGKQFRAVAKNAAGAVLSQVATLQVVAYSETPRFTREPLSTQTASGLAASLSASATGVPSPTLQWQTSRDGIVWNNINGAVGSSYDTPPVRFGAADMRYRVVASNAVGSITSAEAIVTALPTAPKITAHPQSQEVVHGGRVTWHTFSTGDPAPSLQWQVSNDGTAWTNISGATGSSYTTPSVLFGSPAAHYRVVATNTVGSVTSATATVTALPIAPRIMAQPESLQTAHGLTARLLASFSGVPEPSLQWQTSSDGAAWSSINGATGASYTTSPVLFGAPTAHYRVVATNIAGSVISAAVIVTALQGIPTITTQPQSLQVIHGQPAQFKVAATASPAPAYQWQEFIADAKGIASWRDMPGETTLMLVIPNTSILSDQGRRFRVRVSNSEGSVFSNEALLTIAQQPMATLCTEPNGLGWCWINPRPHGQLLQAGAATSVAQQLLVGTAGTIQRSNDGGLTWQMSTSNTTEGLLDVVYVTTDVAIAVGHNGTLLRSIDGGRNWINLNAGTTRTLTGVASNGNAVLIVGEDGVVLRSTDQGLNWRAVNAGTTKTLKGIAFTGDGQTAVAISDESTLLRSIDQGLTWTTQRLPVLLKALWDIEFFGATGLIAGEQFLYKTTDGGSSWRAIATPQDYWGTGISRVAVESSQKMHLFSGDKAWVTDDAGAHWNASPLGPWMARLGLPVPTMFMVLAPDRSGMLVEDGSRVNLYRNGKETGGSTRNITRSDFTGVSFWDSSNGLILEWETQLLRTTDGGVTWSKYDGGSFNVGTGFHMDLVTPQPGIAVLSRNAGVFLSTDGGMQWQKVLAYDRQSYWPDGRHRWNHLSFAGTFGLTAINSNVGAHRSGLLMRTTDGGRTWTQVFAAWPIRTALISEGGIAVAIEDDGGTWRSQDNGATWTAGGALPVEFHYSGSLRYVDWPMGLAASGQVVITTGPMGEIARSDNGGRSWRLVYRNSAARFRGVTFVSPTVVYAYGDEGRLMRSDDAGLTWLSVLWTTGPSLRSLRQVGNTMVIVGSGGTILRNTGP